MHHELYHAGFGNPWLDVGKRDAVMKDVTPLSVGAVRYAVRYTYFTNASGENRWRVVILGYLRDGGIEPFEHIPYEDDSFAWLSRHFLDAEYDVLVAAMGNGPQPITPEDIRAVDTLAVVGPVWCPVASMRTERPYGPGGQETRRGSKHFKPGAKLYLSHVLSWLERGAKRDVQVYVVGRHRGSHRYVTMAVSASWLTHWRVEMVYSPHVIGELWPEWDGTPAAKGRAQDLVALMRERYDQSSVAPPNK